MRSTTSLIILLSIIFAAFGPVFGQAKGRMPATKVLEPVQTDRSILRTPPGQVKPDRKIDIRKSDTKFGTVEGLTEGRGVWVRWRMESELKNIGFRVYSLSKRGGEVPISNIIPGSSFTSGNEVLNGAEYHFFHEFGGQSNLYLVEAIGEDGESVRSSYISPSYVPAIEQVKGGSEMKAETFAPKAGENMTTEDLRVSYELQAEIQNGLISPNLSKHREVISQAGVRISSKADGLIRVYKAELQAAGFDVNGSSTNWQIYLQGVELPMIIGPNSDYIEFFGKGLDTQESEFRTYFLINGSSAGRRIPGQIQRRPPATIISRKYQQSFVRQDRKIYSGQILNGDAENWWGDVIGAGHFDYNFDLSGIDRTPGTRKMTVAFQGFSVTPHVIELSLNGTPLPNITGSGRFPFSGTLQVPVELLLEGQNTLRMRAVGLGFNANGTPVGGDTNLISKLTIDFPRQYVAMSNKLEFYTDNYKNATVSGFTTPNIRVFDLTYESHPTLLTNLPIVQTNGTWGPVMPADREKVLYAVGDGVFGTAASVTPNDPANLADPGHAATMVLISHPSLMSEAQTWAAYRGGQGISTKVVDATEIYDEFNYGVLSSQAIEDFLNYAKSNWQTPPSYVLLVGDAHYDSRNYDAIDAGYWNMVPSRLVNTLYEETGSDEALSDFNNDGLAEIPIGRIASRNGAGVTAAYNKTVAWETALNPDSLNRGAIFVHDRPVGYNFRLMSERVQANLSPSVPKVNIAEGTCTDETKLETCTQNNNGRTEILDAINTSGGRHVLNYTGHGSATFWSRGSFFHRDDAVQIGNASTPILITALTCLNGYFLTNTDSFAEAMLNASNGGAVGVWASTGKTTPDVQEIMAARFFSKLGAGNILRMGDLIADAKAQVPAGADVRLSWALLGDPMLKVR